VATAFSGTSASVALSGTMTKYKEASITLPGTSVINASATVEFEAETGAFVGAAKAQCELKLAGAAIDVPITAGADPGEGGVPALTIPGSTEFLASGKEQAAGTHTVELWCRNIVAVEKLKNVDLLVWAG
jgi:hypothetical protein